ncbi:hypothetical protein BH20ACT17_BH20ACT17_05120 [soil metagenome]
MDEQADTMQERLGKLGDHVDDAEQKSKVARDIAGPGDEAPVRAVTGEETEEGGAQDDPTATVNQPGEAKD